MLEYIFFHQAPFEAFVAFLRQRGLQPGAAEAEEGFEVRLPEDIDDLLSEEIEARYETLMDMDRELFDSAQEQGADNYQAAGVVLNLQSGQTVYAHVDPVLLTRVMTVLSPEEFGSIVNAIVDAVENPDTRSFCERMRDEG